MAQDAERVSLEREEALRRDLAGELHAHFGQLLTAAAQLTTVLSGPDDPECPFCERRARTASDLSEVITEMQQALRSVLYRLWPTTLEEHGLLPALAELIGDLRQIAPNLQLALHASDTSIPPLPFPQDIAVYRIVQEALTNVIRHAGATTASVRLSIISSTLRCDETTALRVSILDDGTGIPDPAPTPGGHGLPSIKRHVGVVGGDLDIRRRTTGGTEVLVTIPLH